MIRQILLLSLFGIYAIAAHGQSRRLTLEETIALAHERSVDANVALNELKKAYWDYRTYKAEQLPEISFSATAPMYSNDYVQKQLDDGSYTLVSNDILGLKGQLNVDQNIPFTGGKISLNTSLEFLNSNKTNRYMSIPVSLTLTQPIFGVNTFKWKRCISPLEYKVAQAQYVQQVENITINAIHYFFQLAAAHEEVNSAKQNLDNANKLHEIGVSKRQLGQISESELMQLSLSALRRKAEYTQSQSDLNYNLFQLCSFLDLPDSVMIEPVLPSEIPDMQVSFDKVYNIALDNNPLAEQMLLQRTYADYNVAIAKGNRRQINLYAQVGTTGNDKELSSAYENAKSFTNISVGISIPLLDWGKRKGQVKVAQSSRDVELNHIRKKEMEFKQTLFYLVGLFNNQAEQVRISEEADRIAQQRYKTSVETFIIGRISTLDLDDARKSKDEVRQNHISALLAYWNYFYQMRYFALYDFVKESPLDAEFETLILQ